MKDKLQRLAALIKKQTLAKYKKTYPNIPNPEIYSQVTVKPGRKYTKVDVGSSGKYMVDSKGNIFGIKSYGTIHRRHQYGTLDTIDQYYWGDYRAVKIG
jgi:hypothetical protein